MTDFFSALENIYKIVQLIQFLKLSFNGLFILVQINFSGVSDELRFLRTGNHHRPKSFQPNPLKVSSKIKHAILSSNWGTWDISNKNCSGRSSGIRFSISSIFSIVSTWPLIIAVSSLVGLISYKPVKSVKKSVCDILQKLLCVTRVTGQSDKLSTSAGELSINDLTRLNYWRIHCFPNKY